MAKSLCNSLVGSSLQRACDFKLELTIAGAKVMVTLSEDEVALLKTILTALRAIKVWEIDKALVILSKGDR